MTSQRSDEDLSTWADRIEAVIARTDQCCVDNVAVVAQTASTQEAAASMVGESGSRLMVLAGQQTSGRGRMGRRWESGRGGLALTFAMPDRAHSVEWLSLSGGLAMYRACLAIDGEHRSRLRVKVPNDLVVLDENGTKPLKLGGVLVERRDGLVLTGFGINVTQHSADWSGTLNGIAVSLAQLGTEVSRIEVAERLVVAVSEVWAMDQAAVELELDGVLFRAD